MNSRDSRRDLKVRLARIRCFLLDMDGTVTLGEHALPGAASFIEQLAPADYLFLTNNSSHSSAHYLARLNRVGLPARREQILTSTDALAAWLHQVVPDRQPVVYPVGTPDFEADLQEAGIRLVQDRESPVDYVILAFDTTLVYRKLDIACHRIRSGTPYAAANPDLVCPLAGGRVLPDCGALIRYMEACTGRSPVIVTGKPRVELIEQIMTTYDYTRDDLALVGDRLYTDIAAARNSDILSILVLSGETRAEDLATSEIQPDLVVKDVGELSLLIRESRQLLRPPSG